MKTVFERNNRVGTHPATDAWMQGDRYGNVVAQLKNGNVKVKLDSGRVLVFKPELLQKIG